MLIFWGEGREVLGGGIWEGGFVVGYDRLGFLFFSIF